MLGEAGFDAFTIASLMGHSNVRTTQRYVRTTERNKREAVSGGNAEFYWPHGVNAIPRNQAVA